MYTGALRWHDNNLHVVSPDSDIAVSAILQELAPDFVHLVKRDYLLPWLVQNSIVCLDEMDQIGSNLKLLSLLPRRGNVLQGLVNSLHEARGHIGHIEVLELILEKSREMGGTLCT